MPCIRIPDGFICTPTYTSARRRLMRCYDKRCNKVRWHVETSEEWYGPTWTCLTCGRQSTAGGEGREHRPLDGGRGSTERQKNINRAQAVLALFKKRPKKSG